MPPSRDKNEISRFLLLATKLGLQSNRLGPYANTKLEFVDHPTKFGNKIMAIC